MKHEHGYTLVELLIGMIVSAILGTVILQFFVSYNRFSAVSISDETAFVERLNASDFLRANLSASSGLISQNSIPDNNTLAPDSVASTEWKKLYPVPGTYGDASSITPILYFQRFSKDSNNNLIANGNLYYTDEFIVYLDGPKQQLRVRTLANPNAPGEARITSCPTGSVTASCPEDLMLANNIASVTLRYFSRAGNELSFTSIDLSGNVPCTDTTYPYTNCAGPTFPSVDVVELTLNLIKKPLGFTSPATKSATVIRVALRNT